MIIRMKKSASIRSAEVNARILASVGFDVQVRNGEGYILAALGRGNQFLLSEKLVAVESVEEKNDFFNQRHGEFEEAEEFFRNT